MIGWTLQIANAAPAEWRSGYDDWPLANTFARNTTEVCGDENGETGQTR